MRSLRRMTGVWSRLDVIVRYFSNKKATTLKIKSLVFYSVHTFLACLAKRTEALIGNVHTLVELVPLCCSEEDLEGERIRESKKCRRTDLRLL